MLLGNKAAMRRKDRQVTDPAEIFYILTRCDTLRVAMQGEEYPYVVPVSFGAELVEGAITLYFHCARQGQKVDCLAQNPKVCVEADTFLQTQTLSDGITTRYESVIGFGLCQIVTDPEEVRHGFRLLLDHYGYHSRLPEDCGNLTSALLYRICLNSVTGKHNLPV